MCFWEFDETGRNVDVLAAGKYLARKDLFRSEERLK